MMNFLSAVWHIWLEMAPWLLLGMAIAGLIHVIIPKDFIKRSFQGVNGIAKAVFFGVPMPLCSCSVIPAGLGLRKDGASQGSTLGFLIATPQTGVDSILVAASFLGWPFAFFKVVMAGVMGFFGGVWADKIPVDESRNIEDPGHTHEAKGNPLKAGFEHAIDILRPIWGWLVVGILISAAIEAFIPKNQIPFSTGWGLMGAYVGALVFSLPLYVCATASVPIAAALVSAGLPSGAALVFLMAGPATNAATLGAIHRAFGKKVTVSYLSTLVVGSILAALVFDTFFETTALLSLTQHEMHGGFIYQGSGLLLAVGILYFAFDDARHFLNQRKVAQQSHLAQELPVQGMTCMGCVGKLEKHLKEVPGVTQVSVSLDQGKATVVGGAEHTTLITAIEAAGFKSSSAI